MSSPVSSGINFSRSAIKFTDKWVGRDLLNHSTRFSAVLGGALARKRAKFFADETFSGTSEYARELKTNGITEFGQPFDGDTIDTIADKFDDLIEAGEYTYTRGTETEDYNYGIDSTEFDFAERLPEVARVVDSPVSDVLKQYYGTWFKPVRVNMWRNRHVPPEVVESSEVFSNYWHADPHTTDHVKLFVYLTDVTEDHGPFHAITTDESKRVTRSYRRDRDGIPNGYVEETVDDVIKFTGPKGSTALCNTQTNLHRAGIPAEGNHRDLLQMVFAPTSEPLSDDWIDRRESYAFDGSDHNGFRRLLRY
ncbi:hypothetical protein [Salinirarus marinus]|uniref:hypothetical protein n=1 Tax=Salinirarus marinus TaxID=3068310 RepID=UPI003C6BE228